MIGSLPMADLAPLDYRFALDAAMPRLQARSAVLVRCAVPPLLAEVQQRLPGAVATGDADAGFWVEPLTSSWQDDLDAFSAALSEHAPLVIVASQPLARLIPERRAWPGQPVGTSLRGIATITRALRRRGFAVDSRHGIHSATAISLSLFAQQFALRGFPAFADRLQFAARLRYQSTGPDRIASTVTLLSAHKCGR